MDRSIDLGLSTAQIGPAGLDTLSLQPTREIVQVQSDSGSAIK
jgi:hypothetical protein